MRYFRIIATMMLAFASMVLSTSAYAALEKRVALIIGNGAYTNAPALTNPVTDARAMAAKMRAMGFEIVEGYDLDKGGLERTVRDFAKTAKNADLSLFFYAGHGIAVENKNYLIPVDARFEDSSALDFEAVPVNLVTRQMQFSDGVSLVFLDACRDNPLAQTLSRSMGGGTRSAGIGSGLAAMKITNPGRGLAIAFATSPGAVAYDGAGQHSPFTGALLKHIDEPNTDITEIMSRVTGEVVKTTNRKQRPWLNTSLTGSVILNRVEQATAGQQVASLDLDKKQPVVSSVDTLERQKVLYNLARETGLADDYRAYLDTFPSGLFSANARRSLERLERKAGQTKPDSPKREIEVAKLSDTSGPSLRIKPAQVLEVETVENTKPLKLIPTVAVARMPANAQIEADLGMDVDKRAEVQKRLSVAGFTPGAADGVFGRHTRKALGDWQKENELEVSGFLNAPQLEMLMQQTEAKLASYEPPRVKRAVKRRIEKPVVRSIKRKSRKKVVKKRVKPRKKTVKRRNVRKKKRVVRRKTRRDIAAERRRVGRRRTYEDRYDDRPRRRRRNAIIGGAIVGGAIGITLGRKRKY